MADIDYTMSILHRYLKELSIKVSYGRIRKLLATPMGCSVRGISDALDSLHITHEVYQLPATYLSKIEAPFLALMHNGRYCLVKSIQEEKTILLSDKGKEENLPTKQFIAAWKGVVLIIDETQASYHEPYYQLKQILYLAKKYRCLSTIGLAGIIYLLASPRQTGDLLFNTLTWIGLAVSILIIYKESYNKDFLQRFCKIGNIVDCNEILHSKAASINGIITLGEMALLYYSTLFLSTAFHIPLYYSIWTWATCISIAFTLWSVGYQVIIARKLCMFCLSIDIIIWLQALVLFSTDMAAWHLNISSIFAFILIGTLCWHRMVCAERTAGLGAGSSKVERQKSTFAVISHPFRYTAANGACSSQRGKGHDNSKRSTRRQAHTNYYKPTLQTLCKRASRMDETGKCIHKDSFLNCSARYRRQRHRTGNHNLLS